MGTDPCGYSEPMEHIEFVERPDLKNPPFICAFRGWNDGGSAASLAARHLVQQWQARVIAYLDPEEFYDFQVTRPTVRLAEGVSRVIDWPRGEFAAATVEGRDVVIFTAAEPNVRWRTFTGEVLDTARELGCGMLVTLGAFLTDVPHSRAVPVVGSAADEETATRLGLARSQYQGPTGIVGVLHDASNRSGLPSVSLWAAVSHYLHAMPNPKAARAMAERTSSLLELPLDTAPLAEQEDGWLEGVTEFIAQNEELAEYVERLESATDEGGQERLLEGPMPSGDAIAAELERYLREQEEP